MKKLQFFLVVLAFLAMLTSIAASPLAVSLVDVRNDPGGGVMFVFHVNGNFSKNELKGFVQVQGLDANFDLFCAQVDESTVHCTTSRKTGGQNVVVTFGGATFWTFVPAAAPQYCYNVYDVPSTFDSGTPIPLAAFTTHCQNSPASNGDMLIDFYNPDYDHVYNYIFQPESQACFEPIVENAYYWSMSCSL